MTECVNFVGKREWGLRPLENHKCQACAIEYIFHPRPPAKMTLEDAWLQGWDQGREHQSDNSFPVPPDNPYKGNELV